MEPIVKRFLAELIRWALRPPAQPGLIKLIVLGEEMKKNITKIVFPAVPDGNPDLVATRRFSIETTTEPHEIVFPQQTFLLTDEPPVVKLAHGVEVLLVLEDVDQANNVSPALTMKHTPVDVTAPPQPQGTFGLEVQGEVDE